MKKLVLLFLSLGIISTFFSCEEDLDIKQPGEVGVDVVFTSVGNLQSALLTVYGSFPHSNIVDFVSVWTDEVKLGLTNGGQGISDGSFGYVMNDQSADAAGIWIGHNRLVNLANRVIVNAPNIPVTSATEQTQVNDIVAQARFLRALATIQHLPFFTTDLANDNALGLIIFEDVPSVTEKRLRSTNLDAYNLINADLDFAEANLNAARTDKFFASIDACKAIRARMAIYRKDYSTALTLADELISAYPLADRNVYRNIWTDSNVNLERIFYLRKLVGDGAFGGIWSNVGPGINNNNWYEFGRGLFQQYDTQDIRRYVFTGLAGDSNFTPPGLISTISSNPDDDPDYRQNDQICIYKYPGKNNVPYLADFKIFRVSEMYLIKAEAQIGLNQLESAAQTIITLRNKRYSTVQTAPIYTSQENGYKDLLKERRRELCFEGHRYVDIKRLGSLANETFDRYFRDCAINNSCSAPSFSDYRLTLPIPAIELNANSNAQQNPNY